MLVFRRLVVAASIALVSACSIAAQPTNGPAGPEAAGDVEPSAPGAPAEADDDRKESDDDRSPPDSGTKPGEDTPGDILGTLEGSCGIVKTQLTTSTPTLEQNKLTFVGGETYERANLSPGGQRLFDTPNAGGSSTESEVMSFEILRACEGAKLLKTETEVGYSTASGAITDILVEIGGRKVGVSVTRAYRPQNQAFPDADVKALIQKKLEGIKTSTERVVPADKWVKQILHVFAANKAQADAVVRVLPTIDAAIRANTIVLLTQTAGGGFVYCNPDPPLGSECP